MSQLKNTNQKGIVKQFLLDVSAAAFHALIQSLVWCKVSKKLFHTKRPVGV
jgi:hypothetical protein